MPDGVTPTGIPYPDVAISGHLYTDDVQSVTWTLGISDFLAPLSPNTASVTLVGQVTASPGDDLIITSALGVQWRGRVDTTAQTRDTNGDWWTTINGTDLIGALGATGTSLTNDQTRLDFFIEDLAAAAGITLDIVDDSSGLPNLLFTGAAETMTILEWANRAARSSNAMLAMTRDGTFSAVIRESVTPSSVLTLTGVNAPREWTLSTSINVDINRWTLTEAGEPTPTIDESDAADIDTYGERAFVMTDYIGDGAGIDPQWDDWITYGGSQRPVASGTMIVTAWSQDDLILLDPFQWVTEDGTDWQVMSVQHNVTKSPPLWTVAITADNLLDLL